MTRRKEIIELISEKPMTANQLAQHFETIIPEIVEDLVHIRQTLAGGGKKFVIIPASCNCCSFLFRERDKIKKPSKCPKCRSEDISEPAFAVQ